MHIPDGFLSTPVWATMNAVAIPTIGYMAKRAGASSLDGRAPLLGVLGAFVFAVQMLNFPLGPGISSHLIGSALLTYTVGPGAATVVMTAVLAIQAFIFQDGGILALGANVFNLAVAGVLAAYLPFWLAGSGRSRFWAAFTGAVFSVLMGAGLALLQIVFSGISIPPALLSAGMALFFIGGLVEGVITVAVLKGIERINPAWLLRGDVSPGRVTKVLAAAACLTGTMGFILASTSPDVLDHVTHRLGIADRSRNLLLTPLADYQLVSVGSELLAKAAAGLIGLVLVYSLCIAAGRLAFTKRSS